MFYIILLIAELAVAATITVSDQHGSNPGSYAVDLNAGTFWHSRYTPTVAPLPHNATIDLGSTQYINGLSYLPRQDNNANGRIGQYTLQASLDSITWTQIASGTLVDDQSKQNIGFPSRNARYIRINALTEAGNRGQWTSAAEFDVIQAPTSAVNGQWGPLIPLPLVPAAAFIIPTSGKILTFSSNNTRIFGGGTGNTRTATYDPITGAVSQLNVQNTQHDMFCPGMSLDAQGRAIITGGDDDWKTSIYDAINDAWVPAANMKLPRGYQSTATTSDGRIFNIGGSWKDKKGGKNGEIYNPITNTWTLLSNATVKEMLTADKDGQYRSDNHGWLFGWKNGYVFQAGPSWKMNWYGTSGTGSVNTTATRGVNTIHQMCGNAVMFDAVAGKIVTFGGSPNYEDSNAYSAVHQITIGDPLTTPAVETLTNMTYPRAFGNAVVLPNGKVMVLGGQPYPKPFTDTNAAKIPELWDPVTKQFTLLPAETSPRTYHSVALLLIDGRVFSAGGGLCSDYCTTNHFDAQIYSPAYLFNSNGSPATRPVITSISATVVQVGTSFDITTDVVASNFSLIRYGSATHTVNTDQRRIPLTPIATNGTTYTLRVPADSGVAIPGYWMVFVMNEAGTPSVARSVRVSV